MRAPPSRKPESGETKGRGCGPCPAVDPTLSETVPSPAGSYPGPGTRFGGLSVARYSSGSRGTRRNAAKALRLAPPEEEGRVGGRRPSLSPPRASPLSSPPPRTTSSPGAHPATGTGCSFAPVPPAAPPPPPLSLSLRSLPPLPPRPAPAPCLTPALPRSAALGRPGGSHPSRLPPRTRSALEGCPGRGGPARVLGIHWPARGEGVGRDPRG